MAGELITQESTLSDLKDPRVPRCLFWSMDDVVAWIKEIGFPEYEVYYLIIMSMILRSKDMSLVSII